MNLLRLTVGPDAEREIERIDEWWRTRRPRSPDLFLEEFDRATRLLRRFPKSGGLVQGATIPGVRRVLLRKSRQYLYYRHSTQEVQVLIVWGAQFGDEPNV